MQPLVRVHIGQPPSYVAGYDEFISCHVGRWLSDVHSYQGLHIQLYIPDDGCKKRPKHVEQQTSEIKVTTQLHRVGLFNTFPYFTKTIFFSKDILEVISLHTRKKTPHRRRCCHRIPHVVGAVVTIIDTLTPIIIIIIIIIIIVVVVIVVIISFVIYSQMDQCTARTSKIGYNILSILCLCQTCLQSVFT